MSEKENVFMAALAGLLHDVGETVDISSLHAPTSDHDWTQLVQTADKLASGGCNTSPPSHLLSIFARLQGQDCKGYTPIAQLDPQDEKSLFPQSVPAGKGQQTGEGGYRKLWSDFEQACKSAHLPGITDLGMYLETILEQLQNYAWCMPSSAGEDVSLFNHVRVRAAISACLAADKFAGDISASLEGNETPVCMLVWGDLSGLQKFIYTLASEGAAKSLRARSFYVQLLGETLAHRILHELKLPVTNSIYVGGGGFQLLVALRDKQKLPDIVRDLTERLLAVHQGELGLTVEWEPVTVADFANFGQVYDRLGKRLNIAKRKPFVRASSKILFDQLSQPLTLGGDPLRYCIVTGEDGKDLVPFEKNSTRWKSKFVDSLEALGNQLPKVSYFVLKRINPARANRAVKWQKALSAFGMEVHLVEDGKKVSPVTPLPGEYLRVWRLQPEPTTQEAILLAPLGGAKVVSYRPFARLTPTTKDKDTGKERPKTFDELAREPVQANCGFKRWGVLRMDVDNLGNLFSQGFGSQVSLARITTLSFALRLFFEGYLPQLVNGQKGGNITRQNLSDHLYIQYSGGDDLFVVGAWDALPEFARRIHEAFGRYAAGNPKVTISGGVELFSEKYPLYLAAQEAGEAEHAAKSLPDKNAVCFLGQAFPWQEFDTARQLAYRLAGFVKDNRIPRSLIQTMLMFYAQQKEAIRKNRVRKLVYGRWTWLAAYQFSRVLKSLDERKPELQEARREIENLRQRFTAINADLRRDALAARWTQFLTR